MPSRPLRVAVLLLTAAVGAVIGHILAGDPAIREDPLDYTIDNDNHY